MRRLLGATIRLSIHGDRSYDVSLDARRFLFVKEDTSTVLDIVVVLDWLEELKAEAPTTAQ